MKKILFAVKTSVCCLLAMYLIFFNLTTVANAAEAEGQTQAVADATVALVEISSYEIAEGVVEAGQDVKIKALKTEPIRELLVDKVSLLSTGEELEFTRNEEGMTIKAKDSFKSDMPLCFKIKLL